jgi:lipid-A-disaccharide synthase
VRVFICAGEASADAYGAVLAGEILKQGRDVLIEGVGGARMRAEGVKLHLDSSGWGVISIFQVMRRLPQLASGYYAIKKRLTQPSRDQRVFVPIDFGYMNIRLARHAKKSGWKVLYFVPPGSWRRDRQGRDLPEVTDAIVTPFSWSAEILRSMRADAYWFGHPIKQLLPDSRTVTARSADLLAVLPGSRAHEIDENLPLIAKALKGISVEKVEFALAPSVDPASFRGAWEVLSGRKGDTYTVGESAQVLSRAWAAIVCSGTATLEAALCRCPMVVVYKLSKGMQMEVKLLRIKRPQYVALPNILMDRGVVPELIQEDATPEKLREELTVLMADSPTRAQQLTDFEELDELLGPSDAITKAADLVLELGARAD